MRADASGTLVNVWVDGWRMGRFLRTVERGKRFGFRVIHLLAEDRVLTLPPDHVYTLDWEVF